jgi:putative ABC transport system permease protein
MTRDLVQQAYGAMRHDLRKTLLTVLGMAWGITTVVLLLAYGNGFAGAIDGIFLSLTPRQIGIFPGRTSEQAGGSKAGTQVRLTQEDIDIIHNTLPLLRLVSRFSDTPLTVQAGSRSASLRVQGFDPSMRIIGGYEMADGRFMNDDDNATHAHVAVLGSESKQKLFSGMPAIGEEIRIRGVSFQVIGIGAGRPQGKGGDSDANRVVLIPYDSGVAIRDNHYMDGIWLDTGVLDHGRVTQELRNALAAAHRFSPTDRRAVYFGDAQEDAERFATLIAGLKVLLAFIGTLTLGIGGIGLMNIMLVSVTQRTREIGMEKALGARKKDILLQFLAEALAITAVGGVAGILLSYLVAFMVGSLTFYSAIAMYAGAGDIHLVVDSRTLLIATAILIVVGWPAEFCRRFARRIWIPLRLCVTSNI